MIKGLGSSEGIPDLEQDFGSRGQLYRNSVVGDATVRSKNFISLPSLTRASLNRN